MKTTISTVFILFTFALFSQVWVKSNPVWHYDYWTLQEYGFIKIEQDGDTVLQGYTCQKLNATKHAFFITGPGGDLQHVADPFGEWYTRASSDTVYYWDNNHFNVLYDFSASPGDSWLIQNGVTWFTCNDSSYTKVESVGTVDLNGEQATQINLVDSVGSSYGLIGAVNSRFGAMEDFLFPTPRNCDSNLIVEFFQYSFKCFSDDSLEYNPSGEDCEYLLTHLGLKGNNTFAATIAPNPADDLLHVTVLEGSATYCVFNLAGQQMEAGMLTKQSSDLPVSQLPDGMYILKLTGQNGETNCLRFCVSR